MSDRADNDETSSISLRGRIDQIRAKFEDSLSSDESVQIEYHLSQWDAPTGRPILFGALLSVEIRHRTASGQQVKAEEYCRRFPDLESVVVQVFQQLSGGGDDAPGPERDAARGKDALIIDGVRMSDSLGQSSDESGDGSGYERTGHTGRVLAGQEVGREAAQSVPERIGRYHVKELIGQGGFGQVYRAHDETLNRDVAIKIPRPDRIGTAEDIEAYLTEARTVAGLKHPHIVPVYDAGQMEDGRCYVVSEHVEGKNLAQRIKQTPLGHDEAAELVATIAEALHCAHQSKLVHRDVKPANILIDGRGKAFVTDFGLALRPEELGKEMGIAGTPNYMSPEQARGEGHLVDGRSDIFSLGVMFYELLTSERPFTGATIYQTLDRIQTVEARPPRQINDQLPKEYERICLKSLSKSMRGRYTTALDMADDLRSALAASAVVPRRAIRRTTSRGSLNESRLPLAHEDYERLARSVTVPRLLLHLINRKQHEAQLRRAIETSRQRTPPCPVVSVVTGGELQCHDQFVERLKEVALPAILGMDRDVESVRAIYIDFPGYFEDSASFHQYLCSDLSRRMRLQGEERPERIAHSLRDRATLVHAEISTADWDRQGQQKAESFFRFWDQLEVVGGLPLIVCLRVKYYGGIGIRDRWQFSKRNRQMRRHFGQLDLSAYRGVSGVVLSELQSITRKEAEDWAQGEASEILDCRELLPRIRRLYQRVTGIPMETLTMELRNMIESIASP